LTVSQGSDGNAALTDTNGAVVNSNKTVSSGQTSTQDLVVSGGTEDVQSGGHTDQTVVDSAGHLTVDSGGSDTNGTINDGGVETVGDGGSADGTTLNDPGLQIILAGASATNVSIAGGEQDVYGSALASIVTSGGIQVVEDGGLALGSLVSSGGTLELLSGASYGGAQIGNGGTLEIGSGYTLDNYTVASGVTLEVASGGTANAIDVQSGGTLELDAGATATGFAIDSGGTLALASGYTLSGSTVSSGMTLEIDAGGIGSATVVSNGGTENVLAGGIENGATIDDGGIQNVSGDTSNSVVDNGGTENIVDGTTTSASVYGQENISSGGTSYSATIFNGGTQYVTGISETATVADGGAIFVVSDDAEALDTQVSGGVLYVYAGTAAGASLLSGAIEVLQGATASDTTVDGGEMDVFGAATSTTISGGYEYVSGGTETGAVVSSGGTLDENTSGVASGTEVSSGGMNVVESTGSSLDTLVDNGGAEVVEAGGSASGTIVTSGGVQFVTTSGGATGTDLQNGGTIDITNVAYQYGLSASVNPTTDLLTVTDINNDVLYSEQLTGNYSPDTFTLMSGPLGGDTEIKAVTLLALADDTGASATDGLTNNPTITYTPLDPGDPFLYSVDGSAYTAAAPSFATDGSADGTHTVAIQETTSDGTIIPASLTFELETTAPIVTLESASGDISSSSGTLTVTQAATDADGAIVTFSASATDLVDGTDPVVFSIASGSVFGIGNTLVTASATDASGNVGTTSFDVDVTEDGQPCYCPGTLITTDKGDVPVEALTTGDHVLTHAGELRPIKWIGRRSYGSRFVIGRKDILPVRIKAGALGLDASGASLPRRDLWISPHHAMYLDGVLIEAKDLLNGVSVVQAEQADDVTYIHIELDSHDVILAEGAWSETFLDENNRGMFHNARDYHALYPQPQTDLPTHARYYAPRLDGGFELECIWQNIAELAGIGTQPETAGPLRGFIDLIDTHSVQGWAQDCDHPDVPVCLAIHEGETLLGHVLAGGYRADLAQAGLGSGRHAFAFNLPARKANASPNIIVTRALDGSRLAMSETAHTALTSGESGMKRKTRITPAARRAVMQEAHRKRRDLGITMSAAIKQAWAEFKSQEQTLCVAPVDLEELAA
jgi:autotransporter passenger strand-loop-strand repeat protein